MFNDKLNLNVSKNQLMDEDIILLRKLYNDENRPRTKELLRLMIIAMVFNNAWKRCILKNKEERKHIQKRLMKVEHSFYNKMYKLK